MSSQAAIAMPPRWLSPRLLAYGAAAPLRSQSGDAGLAEFELGDEVVGALSGAVATCSTALDEAPNQDDRFSSTVEPDALARLSAALGATDPVSAVPRQMMGALAERLIGPMITLPLLDYLPVPWMRRGRHPSRRRPSFP